LGVCNARNNKSKDDKIHYSPAHDDALIVAGDTTNEPTIEANSSYAYRSIIAPNSGNNFSVMPPISELRKHNTTAQSPFFHAEQFEKSRLFLCYFHFWRDKKKVNTRRARNKKQIGSIFIHISFTNNPSLILVYNEDSTVGRLKRPKQ